MNDTDTPDDDEAASLDGVLLDLVLGLLEPAEEEAWRARCAEDPALQARVDALETEQGVLLDVLSLEPRPAGLEERLVAGLRSSPALPRQRSFRWGPWVAAAAGLLLAALGGLWVTSRAQEAPRQALIRKTRVSELEALGLGLEDLGGVK